MNQNEDGDNHRSIWQGEWNHLLAFVLCRIVPYFEQYVLLHALSSSKHVTPNLYKLDWQWQHLLVKVQKSSLVMMISIRFCVWWGKRWEFFFCMWAPFFDMIIATISRSISWVIMCSLSHGQRNKWIPKSWMVWSH
jgi:hypothetical protein